MKNRITYLLGAIILVTVLGYGDLSFAQQAEEYALKASFVERFVQFVDWPGDQPSDTSRPLVVGVMGDNPFKGYLNAAFDQLRDTDQEVEVKQIKAMDEIKACDLLFVSKSESKRLQSILDRTADRPILTIGDTEGYTEAGVIINFYVDGDRLHFKINIKAVNKSGLHLDSFLLDYAQIVDSSEVPDDES